MDDPVEQSSSTATDIRKKECVKAQIRKMLPNARGLVQSVSELQSGALSHAPSLSTVSGARLGAKRQREKKTDRPDHPRRYGKGR